MKVKTYLKRHPEIKEFWIESGTAIALCRTDSFDDMNRHGNWTVIRVEEEPEELVTLHVR